MSSLTDIAERAITFDGKIIGRVRYSNISEAWLATIEGNVNPDYMTRTYEKAAALLVQRYAAFKDAE